MKNSIFKATPNTDDVGILFDLEGQSLLEWLIDLSDVDPKQACLSILQTQQALNKKQIKPKKRIPLLNLINEYLKQYISQLKCSCWDAKFPFADAEKEYAEIIAWNYLALGEGYLLATESTLLKSSPMTFSLAMALESMRQAQLHIAVIYCCPNVGFWQCCFRIYAFAEKKKLLELKLEDFNNITLSNLFVQILAFQLCDTNQYSARDMRTIFNFLEKVSDNVNVHKNPVHDTDHFIFDIDGDNPPINIKMLQKFVSDSVRYFSPTSIAENIEQIILKGELWTGTLKSINEALFHRVAKTLGLAQKRLHSRKKEDHVQLGIVGFENILSFLYKATKKIDIKPIESAALESKRQEISTYGGRLEVMPEKTLAQKRQSKKKVSKIWTSPQNTFSPVDQKVVLKKINIFDSSASGYSVCWDDEDNSKVKVGDIFGILSEDKKRLEIAIIRRVAIMENDKFRFGAEVVGFKSEIVYITDKNPKNESAMWGILIPSLTPEYSNSLIYSTSYFSTGDHVNIQRNHQGTSYATLKKELYSTTTIVHTELTHLLKPSNVS